MPRPLLAALLLLFSLPALSGEPGPDRPGRVVHLRINRPDAPESPVQEILVAGGVSTVLAVPWELRARGTGVAGRGERPFEVLLGSRRAVVTPTRPLVPGERFPFVLRLGDGTVIPLVLVATPAGQRPDRDVAFSFDFDDAAQLRVQLAAVEARAQGLEEQLRQALQEQESEDAALAQLLVGGGHLTALEQVEERTLVADERGRITLETYAATAERRGARKVGVVLTIANRGSEPMEVGAVDLYNRSTLARIPFGARAAPTVIPPGGSGRVSVALDEESIRGDALISLELKIRRGEAVTGLTADVAGKDFDTTWWPF